MIEKNIACEETYGKRQFKLNRTWRSDPDTPAPQGEGMAGNRPLFNRRRHGASRWLGIDTAPKHDALF